MGRPFLQPSIAPLPDNPFKIDGGVIWNVVKAVILSAALILGALGAMLLARRLNLRLMQDPLLQTRRTSAFIFVIFLGATAVSVVLRVPGGDEVIEDMLLGLPISPSGIVLAILIAMCLQTSFLKPPVGFALYCIKGVVRPRL